MARSGDPAVEIWGTWEELLLACAVHRHGTRCWDSVAMEVQSRSPTTAHLLTPQSCRQRYHDLHRRFGSDGTGSDGGGDLAPEIPWLDELRKIRVAELRREVERYDVSIVSLQVKVKRLKEERERSLRETETGEGEPDPKEEERRDNRSPESTPEAFAGDQISGRDSGHSCKESNSTDLKEDEGNPGADDGKVEKASAPDVRNLDPAAGGNETNAGEGSYNGSSDTIAKGAAAAAEAEADVARPRVGESGESVAESKERDGEKENSDVQSSVSLSKRRRRGRRRKAVSGDSSADGGEGREADDVSKQFATESQPLMAFLEIIRSRDCGSVFESRLESQRSTRYRNMIRRHVDLEMVRRKLERDAYTSVEFFRDLRLLCTNAVVFFPKGSPESDAAVSLLEIVAKETSRTLRKPPPLTAAPAAEDPTPPPPRLSPQPPHILPKLKLDLEIKPDVKRPAPLIACKKRSSISAKTAVVAETKEERDEKREGEDQSLVKKKIPERSGTRGLRSNTNRGRSGGPIVKSPNPTPAPAPAPTPTPTPTPTPSVSPILPESTAEPPAKSEKKSGGNSAGVALSMAKKRGAATFLNRINGKSPRSSSKGALLETLKGSPSGSGEKATEQKKAGGKADARKEQMSRQKPAITSSSKGSPDQGAPVKRSVGRPPKRTAPPPAPPPAKRAREEAPSKPPPMSSKKKGRK